ncbi:serine-type D-Ala-D-Ala carboxypeptidase [Vibrio ziniensis]|uniref:Serine-type D-Ala-D-Ala carboxypeptidase n=1 Tax=Vibrio ziniensis TaxID=2711221 RepID=A0A6G7CFR8_9VIBR|nr:serine-type D-Ala-D-Ala carboxypeptidase [Vibrio ziniensis]QIH40947.1 serine-type D-Ala-D-Ala carboxypeptidase [Vibrio ziniensis]
MQRIPLFKILSILLLATTNNLASFETKASQVSDPLPESTRYTLILKKLDDKVDVDTQAINQYFPPASTLKVITALAAKLALGDEFRFQTKLTESSQGYSLIFSGDPTLSTAHINELLAKIKLQNNGIISGDLWIDNTVFNGYEKAVGWPWDVTGICYSAPVSSINIDGNCIQSSIYTEKDGQTRVYVPEQYPVYVMTNAQSVSEEQQKQSHCDLELYPNHENHYLLSGCLTERSKPLPLKFAVQNTELYAQRIIYRLLNQLGISLKGEIKIGTMPEKGKILATHQSESLQVLLETMLKDSDNLIADTLTKTIGLHVYQQAGSFNNGTEAIKEIIAQKTGISLKHDQLIDGSGLSRNNRLQASSMLQVLYYIWQHDSSLGLIDLLPSSGETGTLQYRRSMRDEAIKGRIKAKSGSLYGTHNMAGYGLDKNGKPSSVFIQFVTDYFPPEVESEVPVEAPLVTFEKGFYRQVIELSN